MTDKPTDIANAWASSGTKTDPGSTKKSDGWDAGEQPPSAYMNFWMNRIDVALQSLNERGTFNYDAATTYPADGIAWLSNQLWISQVGGNINNTPSAASIYWQPIRLPNVTLGNVQPANGTAGNLWLNTDTGVMMVCTVSYPTNTWVQAGAGVTVSNTAPATPDVGKLWYDTTTGIKAMKVWDGAAWQYVDHDSVVYINTTPPANPKIGQKWWSNALCKEFIYYNDGTASYWVESSPQGAGVLQQRWDSAAIAYINAGGGGQQITLIHNLGVKPLMVLCWMTCTTNDGDFTVGQRIALSIPFSTYNGTQNVGVGAYTDIATETTVLKINFDANNLRMVNLTGGHQVITQGRWDMYFTVIA